MSHRTAAPPPSRRSAADKLPPYWCAAAKLPHRRQAAVLPRYQRAAEPLPLLRKLLSRQAAYELLRRLAAAKLPCCCQRAAALLRRCAAAPLRSRQTAMPLKSCRAAALLPLAALSPRAALPLRIRILRSHHNASPRSGATVHSAVVTLQCLLPPPPPPPLSPPYRAANRHSAVRGTAVWTSHCTASRCTAAPPHRLDASHSRPRHPAVAACRTQHR
jgi:hypothetical protein